MKYYFEPAQVGETINLDIYGTGSEVYKETILGSQNLKHEVVGLQVLNCHPTYN